MKKVISIFLILIVMANMNITLAENVVSAKSAVLIEEKSGKILFEKNCNAKLPMASTTKIMTALTVLRNTKDLNQKYKIPLEAIKTEGSSMYLCEGEELSIMELLYGIMLVSGNDAANALAIIISGSKEKFAELMNKTAKDIGLQNTNFQNPSGLPNDNHYTTAYELALITQEAFKYEEFAQIVSCQSYRVTYKGIPNGRLLNNHNKLLRIYEGCDGVKTGFTKEAGRCLVTSATRNNVHLIAVTLDASNDWQDHQTMYDSCFPRVKSVEILAENDESLNINVIGGLKNTLELTNVGAIDVTQVDNELMIDKRVELPSFVYAPIKKGQKIGKIVIYKDGAKLAETPLVAKEDIMAIPKESTSLKFKRCALKLIKSLL